ncbi:leucine-rich repeats and immunoglobulin-like domains protein 1 [Plakobranchus ocellatus]|uniref:Leucine-rich repeats and immunoglobulin-like domains protein 1 n=1 Tax=Plakobranchus ocellatus TaxID=259542 RepID=A0AAV4E0G5_9GAST|nr:leucine-rich repeats and immunoglobulin-like domains protein 1 [Plakobranchus ocellatus]
MFKNCELGMSGQQLQLPSNSTSGPEKLIRATFLMINQGNSFLQAACTGRSNHDELFGENVPVPEFLPGANNITVREGGDVQLPCSVRNLGTKQVAWRDVEEDRFLTIGTMTWSEDENVSLDHSRSKIDGQVTVWNLQIRHVRPRDAGLYECQVTSRAGLVRLIKLNVVEHDLHALRGLLQSSGYQVPSVPVSVCGAADMHGCLISITGKKYVDLGEKIELTCNASGGKVVPDEIDWFKGGDKINSKEKQYSHVLIVKSQEIATRTFTSQLIIDHSKLSDTGNYICRSSRNDIANLPVTVLHAASVNTRRGVGPGPLTHDKKQEIKPKNGSSARHDLVPKAQILAIVITSVLLSLARWISCLRVGLSS